jgi:hypothetical protein
MRKLFIDMRHFQLWTLHPNIEEIHGDVQNSVVCGTNVSLLERRQVRRDKSGDQRDIPIFAAPPATCSPNPSIHPNNSAIEFIPRHLGPKPLRDPQPSVSLFIVILSKRFLRGEGSGRAARRVALFATH